MSSNTTTRTTGGTVVSSRTATGVIIVLVAQLMLVLDATVVNVALPRISTDLHFGPASLSWVLNAYTLAFGGLLMLGGRIGDTFGRLRVFEIGLGVFTVASILGGLAQNPGELLAMRALQGAGAALAAPSVLALLTTATPDTTSRNKALALFGAVSSGGASLGLLLGGLVTDVGSWRWTLFINVPIGLAVLATARRHVTETAKLPGRFDVLGAIGATGGSGAIVWALVGAPSHGWTSVRTLAGLAIGLAFIGFLTVVERRVSFPLVQPALLRSRTRVGALALMALVVGGQLSMFFLVVQYVQDVLGFGPLASGFAFLPLSLGIFTMSRFTARLVGRFGAFRLLLVGTAGLTLSFVWLSNAGTGSSYVGAILGPMLLNGLCAGLSFMPITSTALADIGPEQAGSASGLLQTTQQLGSAVGVAVIVSVYAAHAVPSQFVPGAREAFLTSAVFLALAFTVTLLALRPRPAEVAPRALDEQYVAVETAEEIALA